MNDEPIGNATFWDETTMELLEITKSYEETARIKNCTVEQVRAAVVKAMASRVKTGEVKLQ